MGIFFVWRSQEILKIVIICSRCPHSCKTSHSTALKRMRMALKFTNRKLARAKHAKLLFFIVKYANLWPSCCRRRLACLRSLFIQWRTLSNLSTIEALWMKMWVDRFRERRSAMMSISLNKMLISHTSLARHQTLNLLGCTTYWREHTGQQREAHAQVHQAHNPHALFIRRFGFLAFIWHQVAKADGAQSNKTIIHTVQKGPANLFFWVVIHNPSQWKP